MGKAPRARLRRGARISGPSGRISGPSGAGISGPSGARDFRAPPGPGNPGLRPRISGPSGQNPPKTPSQTICVFFVLFL